MNKLQKTATATGQTQPPRLEIQPQAAGRMGNGKTPKKLESDSVTTALTKNKEVEKPASGTKASLRTLRSREAITHEEIEEQNEQKKEEAERKKKTEAKRLKKYFSSYTTPNDFSSLESLMATLARLPRRNKKFDENYYQKIKERLEALPSHEKVPSLCRERWQTLEEDSKVCLAIIDELHKEHEGKAGVQSLARYLLTRIWFNGLWQDESLAVQSLVKIPENQRGRVMSEILTLFEAGLLRYPPNPTGQLLVIRISAELGNAKHLEKLIYLNLFPGNFQPGCSIEEGFHWLHIYRLMVEQKQLPPPAGNGLIAILVREGRPEFTYQQMKRLLDHERLIFCGACLDERFGTINQRQAWKLLQPLLPKNPSGGQKKRTKGQPSRSPEKGSALRISLQSTACYMASKLDPEHLPENANKPEAYLDRAVKERHPDACVALNRKILDNNYQGFSLPALHPFEVKNLCKKLREIPAEEMTPGLLYQLWLGQKYITQGDHPDSKPREIAPAGIKTKIHEIYNEEWATAKRALLRAACHCHPIARNQVIHLGMVGSFLDQHDDLWKPSEITSDESDDEQEFFVTTPTPTPKSRQDASRNKDEYKEFAPHLLRITGCQGGTKTADYSLSPPRVRTDVTLEIYQALLNDGTPHQYQRDDDPTFVNQAFKRALAIDPVRAGMLIISLETHTALYEKTRVLQMIGEHLQHLPPLTLKHLSDEYVILRCVRNFDPVIPRLSLPFKRIKMHTSGLPNAKRAYFLALHQANDIQGIAAFKEEYGTPKHDVLHRSGRNEPDPTTTGEYLATDTECTERILTNFKGLCLFPDPHEELGLASLLATIPLQLETIATCTNPSLAYASGNWAAYMLKGAKIGLSYDEIGRFAELAENTLVKTHQLNKRALQWLKEALDDPQSPQAQNLPEQSDDDFLVPMQPLPFGLRAFPALLAIVKRTDAEIVAFLERHDLENLKFENTTQTASTFCTLVKKGITALHKSHLPEENHRVIHDRLAQIISDIEKNALEELRERLADIEQTLSCKHIHIKDSCSHTHKLMSHIRHKYPELLPSAEHLSAYSYQLGHDQQKYYELAQSHTDKPAKLRLLIQQFNQQSIAGLITEAQSIKDHHISQTEMDKLWEEFLTDMEQKVARNQKIKMKLSAGDFSDDLWRLMVCDPLTQVGTQTPYAIALCLGGEKFPNRRQECIKLLETGDLSRWPDLRYYKAELMKQGLLTGDYAACLEHGAAEGSTLCAFERGLQARKAGNLETAKQYLLKAVNKSSNHDLIAKVSFCLAELQWEIAQREMEQPASDKSRVKKLRQQSLKYWTKAALHHSPLGLCRLFTHLYPEKNEDWLSKNMANDHRLRMEQSFDLPHIHPTAGRELCMALYQYRAGILQGNIESLLQDTIPQLSLEETLILTELSEEIWPSPACRQQLVDQAAAQINALPEESSRSVVEGIALVTLNCKEQIERQIVRPETLSNSQPCTQKQLEAVMAELRKTKPDKESGSEAELTTKTGVEKLLAPHLTEIENPVKNKSLAQHMTQIWRAQKEKFPEHIPEPLLSRANRCFYQTQRNHELTTLLIQRGFPNKIDALLAAVATTADKPAAGWRKHLGTLITRHRIPLLDYFIKKGPLQVKAFKLADVLQSPIDHVTRSDFLEIIASAQPTLLHKALKRILITPEEAWPDGMSNPIDWKNHSEILQALPLELKTNLLRTAEELAPNLKHGAVFDLLHCFGSQPKTVENAIRQRPLVLGQIEKLKALTCHLSCQNLLRVDSLTADHLEHLACESFEHTGRLFLYTDALSEKANDRLPHVLNNPNVQDHLSLQDFKAFLSRVPARALDASPHLISSLLKTLKHHTTQKAAATGNKSAVARKLGRMMGKQTQNLSLLDSLQKYYMDLHTKGETFDLRFMSELNSYREEMAKKLLQSDASELPSALERIYCAYAQQ